jgi:hypothetical protein
MSAEVRARLLSGLKSAESGDYRNALKVWESAIAIDGRCMYALHCSELLKNYLEAIYAGEEASLPDLRQQLIGLGFDVEVALTEEADLRSAKRLGTEPKPGTVRETTPPALSTHPDGPLSLYDSLDDLANDLPAIDLDNADSGMMFASDREELEKEEEKAPPGRPESTEEVDPLDSRPESRPVSRSRYKETAPRPPLHRSTPSAPVAVSESTAQTDPMWPSSSPLPASFEDSGDANFDPWGALDSDGPDGSDREASVPPQLALEEEEVYDLELSAEESGIGSPLNVAGPAVPLEDPFHFLRLRVASVAAATLGDGPPVSPSPSQGVSIPGFVPVGYDRLARPDAQGGSGMNDVEFGGFAAEDQATEDPVVEGFFSPALDPQDPFERGTGDAEAEPVYDVSEDDFTPPFWGAEVSEEHEDAPFGAQPGADEPAEPAADLDADALLERALHSQLLGDYAASQEMINALLRCDPGHRRARDLKRENERRLEAQYLTRLRSLEGVPAIVLGDEQLVWHNLDATKGFVLSQVDGTLTVRDLIDLMHLPRLQTLELLSELVSDGILKV